MTRACTAGGPLFFMYEYIHILSYCHTVYRCMFPRRPFFIEMQAGSITRRNDVQLWNVMLKQKSCLRRRQRTRAVDSVKEDGPQHSTGRCLTLSFSPTAGEALAC